MLQGSLIESNLGSDGDYLSLEPKNDSNLPMSHEKISDETRDTIEKIVNGKTLNMFNGTLQELENLIKDIDDIELKNFLGTLYFTFKSGGNSMSFSITRFTFDGPLYMGTANLTSMEIDNENAPNLYKKISKIMRIL